MANSLPKYSDWYKLYEQQKLFEGGSNRVDSMSNFGPTPFFVHTKGGEKNVPSKDLQEFLSMFKGRYGKMTERGRVSNLDGSSIEDLKNDLKKFYNPAKITEFETIPIGAVGKNLAYGTYSSKYPTIEYKVDGRWYHVILAGGKQSGFTPKAEDFEQGIAYAYNTQIMKMDRASALKAAGVDEGQFEVFEPYVKDISDKVASMMLKSGEMKYYGTSKSKTVNWNEGKSAPKTDLYSDKGRISLKKGGGSRLMTGTSETQYVFDAAVRYFDTHSNAFLNEEMTKIVTTIDTKFTSGLHLEQGIRGIKSDAVKAWVEFRLSDKSFIADVKRLADKKTVSTDKKMLARASQHAKAEFIQSGMGKRTPDWERNLIPNLPDHSSTFNKWWLKTYLPTITKSQRKNVQDVFAATIDHVELEKNLRDMFEKEPEFLKWVIYEAATGVCKFSGQVKKLADDLSLPVAVANSLIVFNDSGIVKGKSGPITPAWAEEYTSKVKAVVGFKSAQGRSASSFQILNDNDNFVEETWLKSIITEETNILEHELNNIEEGFKEQFSKVISNVKTFVNDMWIKLEKTLTNFYNKIFAKIIAKLKEFAQQGIKVFADALGMKINGKASVDIAF
jgi:hypothetical protein